MTISSFYGLTVPATPDTGADSAVEVGFKFKVTVAGWITHIRFYRAAANSGTHTVHLWDDVGTLLATETATGETADAWNNVPLSTPIAVVTGKLYAAAYHTETAHYSLDSHFFDADVTSGQLFGPSGPSISGNGAFIYGAGGVYPNDSFNNSNYGADVFFTDTDPTPSGINAVLNVTEDPDTLVSGAALAIAATLTVTEQPDTVVSSAALAIAATLTVTEQPDTLAATAGVGISASLTVTEDPDTLVATLITVALPGISAVLNVTEDPDTLVATMRTRVGNTINEIMTAVFTDLVTGRVWEQATPDNLPRGNGGGFLPFIVWNIMGGQDSEYVDQTMSEFSNARIQVHCLAPGAIVVDQLAKAARDTLLASAYTVGVLGSPVGTYDAERKLRGRRQLFSIWFRQT